MKRAAITEPNATPTATVAVSCVEWSKPKPNAMPAQAITTSLKVAPAPQNKVVTASDTWPCGSRQSAIKDR